MNFVRVKKRHEFYSQYGYNNQYLHILINLMDDSSNHGAFIERELKDPNSKGGTGNSLDTTFEGDKVIIEPLYSNNPEEERIEISRDALLKLAIDWQKMMDIDPGEVITTQDDTGVITVQEYRPEHKSCTCATNHHHTWISTEAPCMNYVVAIKNENNGYEPKRSNNNDLFLIATLLFETNDSGILRKQLLSIWRKKLMSNSIDVMFDGNTAFIRPVNCPEQKPIVLNTSILFDLVESWKALTDKHVPAIIMTQDDYGIIIAQEYDPVQKVSCR